MWAESVTYRGLQSGDEGGTDIFTIFAGWHFETSAGGAM